MSNECDKDTHQLDFYNHDREVISSIVLVGVTEEKAVEVAKAVYFTSDESEIDCWDLKDRKETTKYE